MSEARRRWSTEQQVLLEMERLNDESMETVQAYTAAAQESAMAEVTHKSMRAKTILRHKASGPRVSMAEAEVYAEADDDVAAAYLQRLAAAAHADALREKLRSIRTNSDALRTAAASFRNGGGNGGPGWQT